MGYLENKMIGFKSVIHQGWFARKYGNATVEQCPYPQFSETAKDWRHGWNKSNKLEPWSQSLRKRKKIDE